MAETVYALCALTSIACSWRLIRGYLQSRVKLLLWSAACFVGLAINNSLVFVDLVIFPGIDLYLLRGLAAGLGFMVLLYGLIWDAP